MQPCQYPDLTQCTAFMRTNASTIACIYSSNKINCSLVSVLVSLSSDNFDSKKGLHFRIFELTLTKWFSFLWSLITVIVAMEYAKKERNATVVPLRFVYIYEAEGSGYASYVPCTGDPFKKKFPPARSEKSPGGVLFAPSIFLVVLSDITYFTCASICSCGIGINKIKNYWKQSWQYRKRTKNTILMINTLLKTFFLLFSTEVVILQKDGVHDKYT